MTSLLSGARRLVAYTTSLPVIVRLCFIMKLLSLLLSSPHPLRVDTAEGFAYRYITASWTWPHNKGGYLYPGRPLWLSLVQRGAPQKHRPRLLGEADGRANIVESYRDSGELRALICHILLLSSQAFGIVVMKSVKSTPKDLPYGRRSSKEIGVGSAFLGFYFIYPYNLVSE